MNTIDFLIRIRKLIKVFELMFTSTLLGLIYISVQ